MEDLQSAILPLVLWLTLSTAPTARSATSYRVNNGANQDIAEWSYCRNIANATGRDIFIPTNTSAEWSGFFNNSPGGITVSNCGPCPAIEHIGSAAANGNTNALTISFPGGTAVDDVLIAKITTRATGTTNTLPTPTGWTKLGADLLLGTAGGGNAQRTAVYYLAATATEIAAGEAVWTLGATGEIAGVLAVYRNVDTAAPIDTSSTASYTSNASSIVATQITTATARTMLIALYAINNNLTFTPPALYTERVTSFYNNRTGVGLADAILENAGASGTPTVSISANNNRRTIRLVALTQDASCP